MTKYKNYIVALFVAIASLSAGAALAKVDIDITYVDHPEWRVGLKQNVEVFKFTDRDTDCYVAVREGVYSDAAISCVDKDIRN